MSAGADPLLRISTTRSGSTAVVRLVGEVDLATTDRLRGRLRDLLAPGRADPVERLVVDAAGLAFLDVTGLRVLLDAEAVLRRRGGTVVVRAPNRGVRRLLELVDAGGRRLPVERGS